MMLDRIIKKAKEYYACRNGVLPVYLLVDIAKELGISVRYDEELLDREEHNLNRIEEYDAVSTIEIKLEEDDEVIYLKVTPWMDSNYHCYYGYNFR